MNYLDWIVLSLTLGFIVVYGVIKTRKTSSMESYLSGGGETKWLTIGLSVMATQASAITFISTPGLAFEKGMAFVQNYFGLPLALIIVSAFFIPIYYKLKVITAYEYLEHRFDLRMRLFTAFLFLLQRGLAAGITIYAPAIILSTALGWDLTTTIILVGLLVIIYTVSGGTKAVSMTQKWQMSIILLGMAGVFIYLISLIQDSMSLSTGLQIAGIHHKMEIVSFSLDPSERYTFWTGITGGLFLALSYFGTDQSQVQRYLGAKNMDESRYGLMFNAILKIPMQFFILLTGVLVFLFFEFNPSPVLFNQTALSEMQSGQNQALVTDLENKHLVLTEEKRAHYSAYNQGSISKEDLGIQLESIDRDIVDNKDQLKSMYASSHGGKQAKESDFVFLYFILNYLPHGVIGLLLCVIISAAMSSTAGEINALAATTAMDFVHRLSANDAVQRRSLLLSKLLTFAWGIFAILFALFAHMVENLIEAVNILGSLFYGTILGIFLVGFFINKVRSKAIFIAALVVQSGVLITYLTQMDNQQIAYLWFNLIGCLGVVIFSLLFEVLFPGKKNDAYDHS